MSRRRSKNPISGSSAVLQRLIGLFCCLLFTDALLFLLLWSFCSCDRAGVLSPNGIIRLSEWMGYAFTVGLSRFDTELLRQILHIGQKLFLLIDAAVCLIFLLCRRGGNFRQVEHGSTHWATRAERRPFRPKRGNTDIPLAENIYLTERAHVANRNILVSSSPGGGKTFSVIIPALEAVTRANGSFFCTDTKGALFRDTCRMMRGRGVETYLLNLASPWFSDQYNPLDNIHPERKYTEISQLALAYTRNVRDEEASAGDSIWEDTFRALIVAVWCYQYDFTTNPTNGRPETRAMWRTAELIRSLKAGKSGLSDDGELARIVEAIAATDPLHPTVENYRFIAAGASETVASVIFTAGSKINIFTYPEIQSLTEKNGIPIDRICENPCGVYLNFDIGSPYRALAALFIEQLFSAAYYIAETRHNGKLPLPLLMCLDELPNICRVHSLPERASTSRSYGIDLILCVQSMQQLERMFHKADETLKNNCVTHIYLGTGESKALEEISKALGKTTIDETSRSRNVHGRQGGGSDSEKAIGRELAMPAELYAMPGKFAIVKIQHHQPIFARKFPTQKQPWYTELGGVGCPQNSLTVEQAYRVSALERQADFYRQRIKRKQMSL